MIQQLLEKEFSGRQVIVLTHDRGWYSELRQQLDSTTWSFRVLRPWDNPTTGIRWADKTTTFGDARATLTSRPDSAGNDARKIMDTELSLVCERLELRLQYMRGDKNDKRMAHEFLERLIADGKSSFRKRAAAGYEKYADAIISWESADKLLLSWGNRASHTFDVVRSEAEMLIDACEKALECVRCSSCQKNVWFAKAANAFQCGCGEIQWRN